MSDDNTTDIKQRIADGKEMVFNPFADPLILKNLLTDCLKHIEELEKQHEIDNKGNQEWINSLCEQLCKMEDALGFKNDCYDKEGKWVPTIGPWLERVRDLLAAEGEVGDAKERIAQLQSQLRERDAELRVARDCHDSLIANCAAMRQRLKELLEVHEFIDNEDEHQTKATKKALSPTAGRELLERLQAVEAERDEWRKTAGERLDLLTKAEGRALELLSERDRYKVALEKVNEWYQDKHEYTTDFLDDIEDQIKQALQKDAQ